jgi:DNA-directed RNA polymerase subunit N (RpoN/RPB10)
MWKKLMIEKQFKPIIYDYKELVTYLPNSFYYNPKKPYQEIINNISNSSNISNNLNSIMSYTNHKEDNLGNYYKKLNGIKMMPSNITLHKKRKNIDISAFPINPKKENVKNRLYNSLKYKAVNNINNTFSYNYSNTYNNNIYNYNYKSPRPSSLKVKKCASNSNAKSQNKAKSKSKFSMTNIVMVKNKLNKWIKNKIEFNYVPHSINKYKKLMPNKNFIMIISHKKEKRLFLYNEDKAVVQKPKIKKNKQKSNVLDDLNINENNLRRSLVSKNKTYKVNKKHRIIKQYFIDDNNEVEPSFNLENKLIMKKPI